MLSIRAMQPGQERYYLKLAQVGYYTQGGEPQGRWVGSGAGKLQLPDKVEEVHLQNLFRGLSPDGKTPLVQLHRYEKHIDRTHGKPRARSRQPGWDLTFSTPKSVSVLWSHADRSTQLEIQQAHHSAVVKAVSYLEDVASYSRTGKGGTGRTKAGLLVATFEHGTSRALDPELHTHALVLNVGVGRDGKTRTIQSKPFYEHKMTAGVLYRAELAYQLQSRLGISLEADTRGRAKVFRVHGVPKELEELFSKRRQQIEKHLGARNLESASAAAFAALETRPPKDIVPPRSELFEKWTQEGHGYGFTKEAIQSLIGTTPSQTPSCDKQQIQEAFTEAVRVITDIRSHFPEKDLLRHVAETIQHRAIAVSSILAKVRAELQQSPTIERLGIHRNEARYTTTEILNVERRMLSDVEKLYKSRFKPLSEKAVKASLQKHRLPGSTNPQSLLSKIALRVKTEAARRKGKTFTLNEEQTLSVLHATQSPGRIKVISGLAGTGKTTMLAATREAFETSGYRVLGCAYSGAAATKLKHSAGIDSETVAVRLLQISPSFRYRMKHAARQLLRAAQKKRTYKLDRLKVDRKTVLVVDEAGMLGTRDMADVIRAVQRGGGKVILVGDERQLPSIKAGGAFGSIAERIGKVELKEITRQKDVKERDIIKQLSRGEAKEALTAYATRGALNVEEKPEQTTQKLISDWSQNGGLTHPEENPIFAATNTDVQHYNREAQRKRIEAGCIKETGNRIAVPGQAIFVGDRVTLLANSRKHGVRNGTTGTVTKITRGIGQHLLPETYLHVTVDSPARSVGERVLDAISHHAAQLGKQALGKGVRHVLNLRIDKLKSQEKLIIPLSDYGKENVRLAYAFTTHKAQGSTFTNAYVHLQPDHTSRQMAYVQASRHTESVRFYTDTHALGPDLTNLARKHKGASKTLDPSSGQEPGYSTLAQSMKKSVEKTVAHDVMERSRERYLPRLESQL